MIQLIKLYGISFFFFLIIDFFWISKIAQPFYQKHLSMLLRDQYLMFPAFLFYALFIAGLLYFVIVPNLDQTSLLPIIISGALFGFICYATFDLTCLAVFKNFPAIVAIVDMIWGAVLGSTTTTLTVLFFKKYLS